jgi:predicted enzyme related to lactoylglutathione lyase
MKSIEIISLPVASQAKSKDFYLKIGFQLIVEAPMGNGQNWVQMGLPGQGCSISLVSWWPQPETAMTAGCMQGIILLTEDIEKDVRSLNELGVKTTPIDPTPWGKFCHFKDPDGNGFTLHQP